MTTADKIVLFAATLFVGWTYVHFWEPTNPGAFAKILVGERQAQLIDLNQDRILTARGRIGTSHLEVRGGLIRFVRSPCRNQICVHAGWLKYSGEIAACLPNRIAVQIVGNTPHFDSVNF